MKYSISKVKKKAGALKRYVPDAVPELQPAPEAPIQAAGDNEDHKASNDSDATLDWLEKAFPKQLNLTIPEAAEALGVSADFIRDRIEDGSLKKINLGRLVRITVHELARYIEEVNADG